MKTTFIYALNDPVTGLTRYIGKADEPERRLSVHLTSKERNHRTNWIKSLLGQRLQPVLEILDEVPVDEWPMWEVVWIENFRSLGYPLVNATIGGEGNLGPDPGSIEKRVSSRKGYRHSKASRQKTSIAVKAHWLKLSEKQKQERRENTKAAGFGNRKGISPKNKGMPCPPDMRSRISETLKGRPKPMEHLARLQAGSQKRWEDYHENEINA